MKSLFDLSSGEQEQAVEQPQPHSHNPFSSIVDICFLDSIIYHYPVSIGRKSMKFQEIL
jgi:hypothetical protein